MPESTEFLESVFGAIIVVYLLVWLSCVIAMLLLDRRLKNRHPAVWAEVGGSIFDQSIGKTIRFWKFLFNSQHTFMEDARLSRLVVLARFFWVCFALLLLALALVIALMQSGASHVVEVAPSPMGGDGGTSSNTTLKVSAVFYPVVALIIASLATAHFFMRHLRHNHRGTWEALGSPSLVVNYSLMNSIRMSKFLWARWHRTLGDSRLSLYVYVIRLQWASILCLGVVQAVLVHSADK